MYGFYLFGFFCYHNHMKDIKEDTIIHISVGTIIKTVLVLISFYVLYLLSNLVLVLLTAIVVASAVEPAAKSLMRRKIPRVIAVLLVYLIFLAFFGGLFFFFLPPLFQDFSQFFQSLPKYFAFLDQWNPWSDVLSYEAILKSFASNFSIASPTVGSTPSASGIIHTVSGLFQGVINFLLIIVLSFYFAVQEKGIENFLKIIVPPKNEKYIIDLWYRTQHKIGKWMQGQLILGAMVGVLVFLLLTILQVPQAFLLAIIATVLELIPVFGPTISAIPAVIIGFSVSATLGFEVLVAYIFIQQFENHLIYPLVVRNVVGVPPILVIIALLVGLELAGVMGVILSVPLAAALMEIVDDMEKKKRGAMIL